jgi:uncharacterized low-complexity protein
MSQTDNKQAQQKYGRFHSVVTRIQRHPYISLAIPSSIFIFASLTHFLVNDKAIQTIFQVIVYIFGIIIGAILLLIADNHRKADYSRIKIGFLYGIVPLTLLGVAYFSKIIGDITAIIFGIASIVAQIALAYAKTGKSEESGIQKNVSKSSPDFIQGNSPTAIQENSSASIYNNSPISIQNNNNSPISIQNNVTNTQHVTNLIDEQSERERITTDAHKNLNAKDLPSRISAVKNLANVADSWLKDSPNCKKDEKKCQDIIDILCTYIRDSFPLAKNRRDIENSTSNRYTDADRQTLHDEQEVRRLIFEEISLRLSTLDENLNIHQGRWSKFKFNFSQAPIFYKMNGLTFEQLKTNTLKFFGDIDFQDSTFIDSFEFNKYLESNISFRGATFYSKADFSGSQFLGEADFSDVTFRKEADFQLSHFGNMNISLTNNKLDLNLPDFINQFASANFKNTEFRGEAIFYGTRFFKDAYFDEAIFKGNVDFTGSISKEDLSFKQSIFEKGVKFTDIRLVKNPNFKESLFSEDNLKGIICTSWNSEKFQFLSVKPGLIDVLTNNDINPQRNWPRNKLPAGARWFDPTSWNKAYKKYTRVSPPAR